MLLPSDPLVPVLLTMATVFRIVRHARPSATRRPELATLFAGALLSPRVLCAQDVRSAASDTTVVVQVAPDHADWLYRGGDMARFQVRVTKAGQLLPDVRVIVTIGPERMPPTQTDTVRGVATIAARMAQPGFLRATATATVGGQRYTGMATVGFDVDQIDATVNEPADFMAFWTQAIAEARRMPLSPMMTRRPDLSTPEVDVYHVSFQNQAPGSRLYGMLSVPTKPGKYPAMLVLPGAGVRPYFPSVATARQGVIHLTIGIHGIPVDRDSLLYNELRATALAGYSSFNVDDKDRYYYKRVYVGAVRAGDFLFSLPQFDGHNYVVQGGSQGGGLSIVAAVLDPRVRAIAVTHPALAEQFAPFRGRAGGWPHLFTDTLHIVAKAEKMATIRYYDVSHFARRVTVPGIYSWGYNDTTVPPTSSYAVYNSISAPKTLLIVKETGHVRVPEQVRVMDAWLLDQLGVRR